jgi:hypothetical protein
MENKTFLYDNLNLHLHLSKWNKINYNANNITTTIEKSDRFCLKEKMLIANQHREGTATNQIAAYQYNGKKFNSDFGLNLLDYGAR